MMKKRKLLTSIVGLSMILGLTLTPVHAADLEVKSIVANTRVGDGQREVTSFDIEVNDASLLGELKEEDFDITNNAGTIPFDVNTGSWAEDYQDDGIELSIVGNTIKMEVKAFCYSGKYKSDWSFQREAWQVTYKDDENNPLSFNADDVTTLKTKTLDEAKRGTFTYAGLTREYALYVPKNSDGTEMKNVPLVVWNHGGGEYNIDLEDTLIANRGLTAWSEAGYETAVLQIQVANPNYSYGTANDETRKSLIDQNNALQAALIKELINQGTVDANRVYVTGASSGGGATMRFLMQYPELFAGAIPCCSMDPIVSVHEQSGTTDDYETIVKKFEEAFEGTVYTWDENSKTMVSKDVDTEALINVPIYFVHAENDPTCRVWSSKAMYEAMNNLGDTNNKLTIWSDEEMAEDGISNAMGKTLLHWSWVKVLNHNEDGSPMNWLFKQAKVIEHPEEQPTTPVTPDNPLTSVKTGDNAAIVAMASTILLAAGTFVVLKKHG